MDENNKDALEGLAATLVVTLILGAIDHFAGFSWALWYGIALVAWNIVGIKNKI